MRILLNIIFVLGVCFGISSCFPFQPIYVRNLTSDTVYWDYVTANDTVKISDFYPYNYPVHLLTLSPYAIEDLGDLDFHEFEDYGEDYIIVFFFKKKTVEEYGEKYVIENNLYDKRCVVDANGLKKMNYVIVYPYDRK